MTAIRMEDLDTLETPQALDELDDDSERFLGTVLNDRDSITNYSDRMRKKHVPRERDAALEDPEGWVGVFGRSGKLY